MNPYDEGQAAYCAGDSAELNPYDVNDAQYDDWEAGWEDAQLGIGVP